LNSDSAKDAVLLGPFYVMKKKGSESIRSLSRETHMIPDGLRRLL
jgi:hypothetical protein